MDDSGRMDLRHWQNFDPTHLKDLFRDHPALKLMDVLAERDAAIAERETAMAEKKTAYAERDAALLQRDVAYADRNTAWMERDTALAALAMVRANKDNADTASKLIQMVNVPHIEPNHHLSSLQDCNSGFGNMNGMKKQGKKEQEALPRKRKRSVSALTPKTLPKDLYHHQLQPPDMPYKVKQEATTSFLGMDYHYDMFSTPIPYCSCTGVQHQCYRWGKGGWQSACCTNVVSTYPLPMSETKRGARVPGRKMSGGAFKKILERLSADGVDVTLPIDLKDHWAKHGTNRYVTIK